MNQPRCHECHHRRGPRSTAPVAQANAKAPHVHEAQPKKSSCLCVCHHRARGVAMTQCPRCSKGIQADQWMDHPMGALSGKCPLVGVVTMERKAQATKAFQEVSDGR